MPGIKKIYSLFGLGFSELLKSAAENGQKQTQLFLQRTDYRTWPRRKILLFRNRKRGQTPSQ